MRQTRVLGPLLISNYKSFPLEGTREQNSCKPQSQQLVLEEASSPLAMLSLFNGQCWGF